MPSKRITEVIHLNPLHIQIVKDILEKNIADKEVWAFGSRIHLRQLKPFSDLDLVIKSDMPLDGHVLSALKDAFSESNLPITVDIIEWATIDNTFKEIILKAFEVIQPHNT